MDEREIAETLKETVEEAIWSAHPFASAAVEAPIGDTAGFVLNFPHGTFLVTVVQIGE